MFRQPRAHDFALAPTIDLDYHHFMKRSPALLLGLGALALLAAIGGPSGRLAIQMHDITDPAPHRIEATVQLGKAALTLLITWTSHLS